MLSRLSLLFFILFPLAANAQGPNISYPSPNNNYQINVAITPLSPINTGTAVPPLAYGEVATLAGTTEGFEDGGKTSAKFNRPQGVACDAAGNIYVADGFNNRIRKITPNGTVTTLAGNGTRGRINGLAAESSFNQPFGLIVNANGDVYVADSQNNQIRKISSSGVVTLFAGSATGQADVTNGTGGFERFNLPEGFAFDQSGNLYVADAENFSVRMITPTQVVTTFAGINGVPGMINGAGNVARFDKPVAIARDVRNGNLYVADYLNNLVRMITPAGIVSTYAGTGERSAKNGPRLSATFDHPTGLTIDVLGNVYVSDDTDIIRRISAVTGIVSTIAGSGQKSYKDGLRWEASFFHPIGISFDGLGDLYVADQGNNKIRKITLGGGYEIDKALPPGMSLNPKTGEITGTPTANWPMTVYTVTAHNDFGESSTILNLGVVDPVLSFGPIPAKSLCEADFDPGAVAVLPIVYTSSNPAVATVVNNKIHIVGPGTTLITADNGLGSLTQTLTVNASEPLTVNISTSVTRPVCSGTSITLTAQPSATTGANVVYQWYVNGTKAGINNNKFTSNSFRNSDEVSCEITANGGCYLQSGATSNAVKIEILDDAICQGTVPGSFSPNGDGVNDNWNIDMLSGFPDCLLSVFNRYGTKVYQSTGYNVPWDGTIDGKPLAVGVYYYKIDFRQYRRGLSGSVTIIK
ncbi:MAG: gliding motility-associated C-terminal domain-containing protein [Bacteroidota bacterium]